MIGSTQTWGAQVLLASSPLIHPGIEVALADPIQRDFAFILVIRENS